MLLVDDDQARVHQRREHRRPGPDDDVDVAAPDALPLIVALAVGQRAVLNRHAGAEGRPEQRRHRRRQRDLRDHQQRLPASGADPLGKAEVDFRLAAAGDAVQQGDLEFARFRQAGQRVQGRLLLSGQAAFDVARHHHACAFERIALIAFVADGDEAARGQAPNHVGRDAAIAQDRCGQARRRVREHLQRSALPWRQFPLQPTRECRSVRLQPDRLETMRGGGNDALRLRRVVAPRSRWHRRGYRVPISRHVVIRHPSAQLDDRRRQVRLVVEHRHDVARGSARVERGIMADEAANDDALPHRHAHASADRRQPGDALRNAVGKRVEEGDRNGDRDEAHYFSLNSAFTRFISSHTSRLADGVRSRYAG